MTSGFENPEVVFVGEKGEVWPSISMQKRNLQCAAGLGLSLSFPSNAPRENTKTALDTVLLPGYNISNFIGQFVTILSVNKTRDF